MKKKKKEKFKSISKLYFIIPLIFTVALFTYINVITVSNRVEENYEILEKESLSLAKSYSLTIANGLEAQKNIYQMFEDRLMITSKTLAHDDNISDNQYLIDEAIAYEVDAIFYYDSNLEVIYSSMIEHIGWTAPLNHPIREVYESPEQSFVGEIRDSWKNDEPYLYGYYRLDNGEFIQVGLKASTIEEAINHYQTDYLLEQMKEEDSIKELYFIDRTLTIVSSTDERSIGVRVQEPEVIGFFSEDEVSSAYINDSNSANMYYIFMPIIVDGDMVGTFVMTRSIDYIESIQSNIIDNGRIILAIMLMVLGIATYLLFKRSQSFLQLAYYDRVTELPNDLYLRAYLKENINDEHNQAIFLIDIQNLKTINLTYGYEYGDKILKEVSARLLYILKPIGRLFRFSPDRFVFVSEEYNDANDLISIAEDIEEVFNEPFKQIDEHQYIHSKVAIIEINEVDKVDAVLRNASIALNHTKDSQGQYTFFNKDMSDALEKENYVEKLIIEALEAEDENIMSLTYQPIVDAKTFKMTGFEALARMDTDEYGPISPEEFIRVAESKLLISDVGKFMFKQSVSFLKKLEQAYPKTNYHVSINVSVLELLRKDYIEYIKETVKEYKVSPKRIVLEVTESVFEEKFELANKILGQLRQIGFKVSLDDFGTGYSSFYRLREMNMDNIKIDQYFVQKILEVKTEEFIIDEIITLSHKLGLKVIAEGVEQLEQVKYLKNINCDYLQGYYFNKPLKEAELIEYIKEQQE